MKAKNGFIVIVLLIFLSSCGMFQKETEKDFQESNNAYLSFCLSTNDNGVDGEDGITMNNYIYNLSTKEVSLLEKPEELEYTAQYPLSVYDRTDHAVYYSERIYHGNWHGDQLAVYDLVTGKKEILTNNLFAINELIPLQDVVVLSACPSGEDVEQLVIYNKETRKTTINPIAERFCILSLSYDGFSNQLLIICVPWDEERGITEAYNMDEIAEHYPADHYIYKYDIESGALDLLYKTDHKLISRAALNSSGNVLLTQSDKRFRDAPEPITYELNIKTKALAPQISIDAHMSIREYSYMCFNGTENEVFFIGEGKGAYAQQYPRGIYRYHYDTNTLEAVYVNEEGWINNFYLLQGNTGS